MKSDILHLVYPDSCLICSGELSKTEQECCSFCSSELHLTHYEQFAEPTPLDQLFWGRVNVKSTFALLFFTEGSSTRKLLHGIKYKGKRELARYLGSLAGKRLVNNAKYAGIEALIPVPLHVKKRYIRGYNQSEELAKGIAESSGITLNAKVLLRQRFAESQTRMGRFNRWDNIEEAFVVNETIRQYKHIALVDDVVTTGSTLESCMRSLKAVHPELEISVISLAIAR